MASPIYDVAIVGAGAAGLMAAITCKKFGLDTLLIDRAKNPGAKILMSGGTRCNVTNQNVSEADYASDKIRFVRNVLRAFPPEKTVEFFNSIGARLVLGDDGKYYPETNSAKTILSVLMNEVDKLDIDLKTEIKIDGLSFADNLFLLKGGPQDFSSKTVILCTGGLSFPKTGSDGVGYKVARTFGHSLIPTIPSLTPLTTDDEDLKTISGVAAPVSLTLLVNGKKQITFKGPMLFTHFGFSGPSILNMSRHWVKFKDKNEVNISVNFFSDQNAESLEKNLIKSASGHPDWSLKRYLKQTLSARLVDILTKKCALPEDQTLGQLKRDDRKKLVKQLTSYTLPVMGAMGFEKAEVTAGGINLDELNYQTLESKKQPGLFFAGEMLDADGRIGGFNFQWAWASGSVSAAGAKKRLEIIEAV